MRRNSGPYSFSDWRNQAPASDAISPGEKLRIARLPALILLAFAWSNGSLS
jgi:hypothetical protein